MDKSKEYIKMCKKVYEIQELPEEMKRELEDGDFYVMSGRTKIRNFNNELWQRGYPEDVDPEGKPIWLPRQDQLQEMIEGTFSVEKLSQQRLGGVVYSGNLSDGVSFDHYDRVVWKSSFIGSSLEEVLLKITIKEKFNKVWDSEKEEWVHI